MLPPLKSCQWPQPSWQRRYRMLVRENALFSQANFIDRLASLYDTRPALFVDQPLEYPFLSGVEITYRDLERAVNRAANALRRLGVRRGDRVGLVTANRVEIAFVEFGAQKIGAIPVPLNCMLKGDEIRYLVEDSGCHVLVTDRSVFEANIQRRDLVPSVRRWVMVTSGNVPEGFDGLGTLMAQASEEVAPVELTADDVVVIFYTGGTTGFPKGAMLTNRGLMFGVRRYARLFGLLPRLPRQLSLLVMPLAHTSGHQALLLHIAMGTPTLFMGRFSAAAMLEAIERHGVTIFSGTPAMYRMLRAAGAACHDLRSIRTWGGGGDAFSDDTIRTFRHLAARTVLGIVRRPRFARGYGMAETCGQVAAAIGGPMGEGCIGRVLSGLAYRIVDAEGGDVAPGEVGELVLRGPTVMKGYWGAPERTREAMRNGWLHTGDLVRRGSGRRLYIVAREKEVIKCGGYSVFPAEVERELEVHPAVSRCAVVGLRHELKGELPVAAVELEPGAAVTARELLDWAHEHIAAYRCPRRVIIIDAIPLTFALKPRRHEVRNRLLRMGITVEGLECAKPAAGGAAPVDASGCRQSGASEGHGGPPDAAGGERAGAGNRMGELRALRDSAAIVGIGLSRFGKVPGISAMGFALEASKRAIEDAGVARDAIDGVLILMPPLMGEQHGWASRVAAYLGITPAFCSTMDMGGATPVGMIQTAAMLVHAGMCTTVLCAFGCQNNPQGVMPMLFGSQFSIPYGDVGAITFMAHVARRQMHELGVTSEQYGAIAVACRTHAATNPSAQKRDPITLEDHQRSRMIVDPLRLLDCCLVTDGGGACIVTSRERARDLRQPLVLVRGFGQVHSAEIIRPWDDGRGGGREAAAAAYSMAGVGPRDIQVVQLYDGFTPLVMHELGAYGFCSPREAGPFVADGNLQLGGALPANTAGGLLSEGHLSGFGHVAEAVRQMRGTSHCQVPDAEVGMVTGYGGAPHEAPPTVAYTVAILRRG